MAFGFPASYKTESDLSGSRQNAREAIVYAFEALGWSYEVTAPDLYTAKVPLSGLSWGERLTVSLENVGVAVVQSTCVYPLQLLDWGKNKSNINQFLSRFVPKESREAKLEYKTPVYLNEKQETPIERVISDEETPTGQYRDR